MYTLESLKEIISDCHRCNLHKKRINMVFGQGKNNADILFIGEGPGYQEDQSGIAFIGPAGQLLTKAIEGIGFNRDEVYIANIVKCRPPNNRNPIKEEMDACIDYLRWQVKIINPKIIVCLGSIASKNIIDENIRITKDRGKFTRRKGIWLLPTFHPSAVLRDETKKNPFWNDFKLLKKKYEEIKG